MSKSVTDGRGREIDLPDRYIMGKTTTSTVYHTRKCRYYQSSAEGGITARRASDHLIEHKGLDKCPECDQIEKDGMNTQEVCKHARGHISGFESITAYKQTHKIPRTSSTIKRHLSDHCSCDHDIPPVTYDHVNNRWGRAEKGREEITTEKPSECFVIGRVNKVSVYHSRICEHIERTRRAYPDTKLRHATDSAIEYHGLEECKVCQKEGFKKDRLADCAYIRRNIIGYQSSTDFADEHNITLTRATLAKHATGRCNCNCNVQTATYSDAKGWFKDE